MKSVNVYGSLVAEISVDVVPEGHTVSIFSSLNEFCRIYGSFKLVFEVRSSQRKVFFKVRKCQEVCYLIKETLNFLRRSGKFCFL